MKEKKARGQWYAEKDGYFGIEYLEENADRVSCEQTQKEIDFFEKDFIPNKRH